MSESRQAKYRQRMKERGMVQHIEWIPEEHRDVLKAYAQQLRNIAPNDRGKSERVNSRSNTVKMSAIISDCGTYRYELRRVWDDSKPNVLFILLNPSIADHEVDDHTAKVCMGYAKRWEYGGVVVANLFAYRETIPDKLPEENATLIGPDNDRYLVRHIAEAGEVVCGWGDHKSIGDRDREVLAMIPRPMCIKRLSSGRPGHPLYKSYDLKPIPYEVK